MSEKEREELKADGGPVSAYRERVRDLVEKHRDTLDLLE